MTAASVTYKGGSVKFKGDRVNGGRVNGASRSLIMSTVKKIYEENDVIMFELLIHYTKYVAKK